MKKTITIEKEVYEAVLRNSVKVADLEAENRRLKKVERKKGDLVNENYKLKELLTDICCELVDDEEDMTNGLLQYFNTDVIDRIREALK